MRMDTDKTRRLMDEAKKLLLKENAGDYGTASEAALNYINGNISDFKNYLRQCNKKDIYDLIEVLRGQHGMKIHNIIQLLRQYTV